MERFWKFVKKPWLYSKDYADSQSFQQAILQCIDRAPTQHKDELASLLTFRVQTFQEVSVIGEQQTVSSGLKEKVLPKTA
jgi:hypothetical protein